MNFGPPPSGNTTSMPNPGSAAPPFGVPPPVMQMDRPGQTANPFRSGVLRNRKNVYAASSYFNPNAEVAAPAANNYSMPPLQQQTLDFNSSQPSSLPINQNLNSSFQPTSNETTNIFKNANITSPANNDIFNNSFPSSTSQPPSNNYFNQVSAPQLQTYSQPAQLKAQQPWDNNMKANNSLFEPPSSGHIYPPTNMTQDGNLYNHGMLQNQGNVPILTPSHGTGQFFGNSNEPKSPGRMFSEGKFDDINLNQEPPNIPHQPKPIQNVFEGIPAQVGLSPTPVASFHDKSSEEINNAVQLHQINNRFDVDEKRESQNEGDDELTDSEGDDNDDDDNDEDTSEDSGDYSDESNNESDIEDMYGQSPNVPHGVSFNMLTDSSQQQFPQKNNGLVAHQDNIYNQDHQDNGKTNENDHLPASNYFLKGNNNENTLQNEVPNNHFQGSANENIPVLIQNTAPNNFSKEYTSVRNPAASQTTYQSEAPIQHLQRGTSEGNPPIGQTIPQMEAPDHLPVIKDNTNTSNSQPITGSTFPQVKYPIYDGSTCDGSTYDSEKLNKTDTKPQTAGFTSSWDVEFAPTKQQVTLPIKSGLFGSSPPQKDAQTNPLAHLFGGPTSTSNQLFSTEAESTAPPPWNSNHNQTDPAILNSSETSNKDYTHETETVLSHYDGQNYADSTGSDKNQHRGEFSTSPQSAFTPVNQMPKEASAEPGLSNPGMMTLSEQFQNTSISGQMDPFTTQTNKKQPMAALFSPINTNPDIPQADEVTDGFVQVKSEFIEQSFGNEPIMQNAFNTDHMPPMPLTHSQVEPSLDTAAYNQSTNNANAETAALSPLQNSFDQNMEFTTNDQLNTSAVQNQIDQYVANEMMQSSAASDGWQEWQDWPDLVDPEKDISPITTQLSQHEQQTQEIKTSNLHAAAAKEIPFSHQQNLDQGVVHQSEANADGSNNVISNHHVMQQEMQQKETVLSSAGFKQQDQGTNQPYLHYDQVQAPSGAQPLQHLPVSQSQPFHRPHQSPPAQLQQNKQQQWYQHQSQSAHQQLPPQDQQQQQQQQLASVPSPQQQQSTCSPMQQIPSVPQQQVPNVPQQQQHQVPSVPPPQQQQQLPISPKQQLPTVTQQQQANELQHQQKQSQEATSVQQQQQRSFAPSQKHQSHNQEKKPPPSQPTQYQQTQPSQQQPFSRIPQKQQPQPPAPSPHQQQSFSHQQQLQNQPLSLQRLTSMVQQQQPIHSQPQRQPPSYEQIQQPQHQMPSVQPIQQPMPPEQTFQQSNHSYLPPGQTRQSTVEHPSYNSNKIVQSSDHYQQPQEGSALNNVIPQQQHTRVPPPAEHSHAPSFYEASNPLQNYPPSFGANARTSQPQNIPGQSNIPGMQQGQFGQPQSAIPGMPPRFDQPGQPDNGYYGQPQGFNESINAGNGWQQGNVGYGQQAAPQQMQQPHQDWSADPYQQYGSYDPYYNNYYYNYPGYGYYQQWQQYYGYDNQANWDNSSVHSMSSYTGSQTGSEYDPNSRPSSVQEVVGPSYEEELSMYEQPSRDILQMEQEEELPEMDRLTPLHFLKPHLVALFSRNGTFTVSEASNPKDGMKAKVNFVPLKMIADVTDLIKFPGPLIAGETSKKSIIKFAKKKVEFYQSCSHLSREIAQDHALLWDYVAVLTRHNGHIDGSDISEMLVHYSKASNQYYQSSNRMQADQSPNEYASKVDHFRETLFQGCRKEALEFCASEDLWGHAFVLSYFLDPKIHQAVINRFLSSLNPADPLLSLYSHLAHKGGPNHDGDWRLQLAMLIANPSKAVVSDRIAMTKLGDSLANEGKTAAAHLIYLLANVKFSDYRNKDSKFCLLGGDHTDSLSTKRPDLWATNEMIQLTEVFEYLCCLQSEKAFIPSFQFFKYIYATRLAETGMLPEAFSYLELISEAVIADPRSYDHRFVTDLQRFSAKIYFRAIDSIDDDQPSWIDDLAEIANAKEFNNQTSDFNRQLLTGNASSYNSDHHHPQDVSDGTKSLSRENEQQNRQERKEIDLTQPQPPAHSYTENAPNEIPNTQTHYPAPPERSDSYQSQTDNVQQLGASGGSPPSAVPMFNPATSATMGDLGIYSEKDALSQSGSSYTSNALTDMPPPMLSHKESNLSVMPPPMLSRNESNLSVMQPPMLSRNESNLSSVSIPSHSSSTYQPRPVNEEAQKGIPSGSYYEQQKAEEPSPVHYNQQPSFNNQNSNQPSYQAPFSQPSYLAPTNSYPPPMPFNNDQHDGYQGQRGGPPPQQQNSQQEVDEEEEDLFNYMASKAKRQSQMEGDEQDRMKRQSVSVSSSPNSNTNKPNSTGPPGQEEGKGWFGGIFSRFSKKGPKEAFLPSDKEKSIVYNKELGKWVDKNAPAESYAPPPPPPTGGAGPPGAPNTLLSQAMSKPISLDASLVSNDDQDGPPPQPSRFSRKAASSQGRRGARYVDAFGGTKVGGPGAMLNTGPLAASPPSTTPFFNPMQPINTGNQEDHSSMNQFENRHDNTSNDGNVVAPPFFNPSQMQSSSVGDPRRQQRYPR